MNLLDIISKDLETLRKERAEGLAYAKAMADAENEYTEKICQICDQYGVKRKEGIKAAITSILGSLLDNAYDKEDTK